ncbi:MAG: hypothetical protein NTZ05_22105, partial [Chloroflexi bacterium]|nr:hypothetical protein [Chloroflexota bacterium]
VLLSSVAMLMLTGLPQAFPNAPGSTVALALWGGPAAARTVHRIAAACSDFAVIYHLVYLTYLAVRRGALPAALLPGRGSAQSTPQGAATRFTAGHKADYWTAAILLPLQTATGLALVHADMAVAAAPPWVLAGALAVHRTAAVALTGYIIVAHLYHAVLDRAVYPLNTAIFTGVLRRRSYLALFAAEEQAEVPAASSRRTGPRPPAAAQERS